MNTSITEIKTNYNIDKIQHKCYHTTMTEKQNFDYEQINQDNYEQIKLTKQKMLGEAVLRNVRDQTDVEIEKILDPQNKQSYLESEGFIQEYEEGMTPEQTHREGRDNGVAQNPDSSVNLLYDGQAHRVGIDGIPRE